MCFIQIKFVYTLYIDLGSLKPELLIQIAVLICDL